MTRTKVNPASPALGGQFKLPLRSITREKDDRGSWQGQGVASGVASETRWSRCCSDMHISSPNAWIEELSLSACLPSLHGPFKLSFETRIEGLGTLSPQKGGDGNVPKW